MKILIFGILGSGKTVLAQKLSTVLHLPIFPIDRHFFLQGWVERDHDHFLEDVNAVLKKNKWIIDRYNSWKRDQRKRWMPFKQRYNVR